MLGQDGEVGGLAPMLAGTLLQAIHRIVTHETLGHEPATLQRVGLLLVPGHLAPVIVAAVLQMAPQFGAREVQLEAINHRYLAQDHAPAPPSAKRRAVKSLCCQASHGSV